MAVASPAIPVAVALRIVVDVTAVGHAGGTSVCVTTRAVATAVTTSGETSVRLAAVASLAARWA